MMVSDEEIRRGIREELGEDVSLPDSNYESLTDVDPDRLWRRAKDHKRRRSYGSFGAWKYAAVGGVALCILSVLGYFAGDSADGNIIDFTIISREEFLHYKVSYDVRVDLLDGRLPTREELSAVSRHLYNNERKHDRTFVAFYLPGMKVNAGAFASAHHNPNLEVKILESTIPQKYQHLLRDRLGG